jgi:hypothetical protein
MAMLNITSLLKHMDEIRVLLTTKNVDVLAINETRLDCTISDDLVSVPNYDIIRFDRNRNGGAEAVFVFIEIMPLAIVILVTKSLTISLY